MFAHGVDHKYSFKYKAFISYSHDPDGPFVRAFRTRLERLGKKWHELRSIRVFQDLDNLPLSSETWTRIEKAMDSSEYLIFIASPESIKSAWCMREINYWVATRGVENLLIVVTGGKIAFLQGPIEIDWLQTNCLPLKPLKGKLSGAPLYLDMRWTRGKTVPEIATESVFVDNVAKLKSTLLNVDLDDLHSEELRQQRVLKLLTRAAVTGLAVLSLGLICASIFALVQWRTAAERALAAELELSAAKIATQSNSRDFMKALSQAVRDAKRARDGLERMPASTQAALWTAVNRAREINAWNTEAQFVDLLWDKAGQRIVGVSRNSAIVGWDTQGAQDFNTPTTDDDEGQFTAEFSFSREAVLAVNGEKIVVRDLQGGIRREIDRDKIFEVETPMSLIDVSLSGDRVFLLDSGGMLNVSTLSGDIVAQRNFYEELLSKEEKVVRLGTVQGGARALVATSEERVHLIDVDTGAVVATATGIPTDAQWRVHPEGRYFLSAAGTELTLFDRDMNVVGTHDLGNDEIGSFDVDWTSELVGVSNDLTGAVELLDFSFMPFSPPLYPHSASVVAFQPGGRLLLTVGYLDFHVRIHELTNGFVRTILPANPDDEGTSAIAYCPKQDLIVWGGQNGSLRVAMGVRTEAPQEVVLVENPVTSYIESIACSADGWFTVSRSDPSYAWHGPEEPPVELATWSPSFLAGAERTGELVAATQSMARLYDTASPGMPFKEFSFQEATDLGWIWSVAISRDGTRIAVAGEGEDFRKAKVALFETRPEPHLRDVFGLGGMIQPESIAFSDDGKRLAVGGSYNAMETITIADRSQVPSLDALSPFANSLVYVKDGILAGTSLSNYMRIWGSEGQLLSKDLEYLAHTYNAFVDAGPGGSVLLAGGNGEVLEISLDEASYLDVACARLFHPLRSEIYAEWADLQPFCADLAGRQGTAD
ncbi:toll/interleukin-1 receptor domain-containing protein [Hwanghaeella sp.]|uniref:toll/interleukin-1 receptor domain-containing protein n=1 Tax=Hwanghaeella sp. TaxID=2605943 RepID=UPI003CCB7E8C